MSKLKQRPQYYRKKHPSNYDEYEEYYQTAKRSKFQKYHFNDFVDSTRPARHEFPIKTGEWLITIILSLLPIFGLFALLAFIVSPSTSKSKKNYAKAMLIVTLAVIVIAAVALIVAIYVYNWDYWAFLVMIKNKIAGLVK
jgi:hypothetical protein